MIEVEWWEFDAAAELAEQAAGDIGFVVESAVEAHGSARIALSAGPSMKLVHDRLLKLKLDWSKVSLLPTDETLAAASDAPSGQALLRQSFGAQGTTIISLADASAADYREAGRIADERLASLQWPLDLVCLTSGADGHVAGIYPGPDMDRAISGPRGRRAIGLRPDPFPAGEPGDRVTLTADAIASARAVMLVLRGREAREAVERAIEEGPLATAPIGRLLAGLDTSVDILWSAD